MRQNIAKAYQGNLGKSLMDETRQAVLKLALAESDAAGFIQKTIALVNENLGLTASFVEQGCNSNDITGSIICFGVSAQDKPIGSLVTDQQTLDVNNISFDSMQELADIIGISLLSLRQNEELAMLENESEEMLQYAPDVIFVADENGEITMANHKAHDLLGAHTGSLVGKEIVSLLGTQTIHHDELLAYGTSGEKFEVELVGQFGRRLASFTVSLVKQENDELQMLMVGRDITTERQAELALRRTERSTMMAQTIDYLLHEVNNPLGALLSNISTVLRKNKKLQKAAVQEVPKQSKSKPLSSEDLVSQLDQMNDALQNAKRAGGRINDAMKMLRTANQKRTLSGPKSVDPSFELGLAISALELEHKKVRVIKSVDPLPTFDAPPLHLSEIFGALLKNAAEAVEAVNRETRQIVVTGGVRERQIVVTIEDNGPGVPNDYKEKIFMPFFTTKPLGHSIGLGLPMAKDMAKRVGGRIEVLRSNKLGGACFRIILPLA